MAVLIESSSNSMSRTESTLLAALANLDLGSFSHSKRVQTIALRIGKELGLTYQELAHLELGSLLHDVGKQYIPLAILEKKSPLTPSEWELIRMHPTMGWRAMETTDLDETVKCIILGHHLWANGQGGYPRTENLKPCMLTQITTVADVVDAMTSARPYREALQIGQCIEYLDAHAGVQFNPEVVRAFKSVALEDFEHL